MIRKIPEFFEDILKQDYGEDIKNNIIEGYNEKKYVTLRVNSLKTNTLNIKKELDKENITFKEANWYKDALIIDNVREDRIKELDIYKNGEIYMQSLSSMMPVLVLNPKAGENILDMAAAPGGKTSQMATFTFNEAMITACEKNKIRADRLKYNLEKQGCTRVNIMMQDATKLDDFFSFDKILLDSPCSGSGTDNIFSERFNLELITRSVKIQEELLKKAVKILRPGGEMVYSTCSILKRENEEILDKILAKEDMEIVEINNDLFQEVEKLPSKISGTVCIKPNKFYEGFFIAKLRKRK